MYESCFILGCRMAERPANKGLEIRYGKKRSLPKLTYQLRTFLNTFAAQQSKCVPSRDAMIAAEQETKHSNRVTEIIN
jgi:hypothetical protein